MRTANEVSREQAEGGSGERDGPIRTHLASRPRCSVGHRQSEWTQNGRASHDHRETSSPERTARRTANVL